MKSYPALRRLLASGITVVLLGGVLAVVTWANKSNKDEENSKDKAPADRGWHLFGGGITRNMVNTWEHNVPTEWSVEEGSQKNIKWVADLGSKAYGGPVIADGKIFVGTNNENPKDPKIKGDKGVLMCFNEKDGKFLWQAVHDKLEAGRVNDWPREGICSTPFVEGKRIYYCSNRSEVICATTDGLSAGKNEGVQDETYKGPQKADIVWRLDLIQKLNNFPHNLTTCSPLIVGDLLFIITANGVDEGHINIPQPKAPSFIALDKKTGNLVWQDNSPSRSLAEAQAAGKPVVVKDLVNQGKLLMHGQWSNPVYAEADGHPQVLFPGGDGWIYSFEPKTGKLIWKFECNPKNSKYELGGKGTRSDFLGTPVIYENKCYIGVGQDPEHDEGVGHFWCIDITKKPVNKELDLSPQKDNFGPKAEVNKNSGLVWHYGGAAPKGSERNYLFGRTMSTAAIKDDLVYIAELAGYLHCLDAKTGKQYWEHNMEAAAWSSAYWVDNKIYMGNDDGKVLIFAHGKDKKLLGEIDMGGKVRAMPTVANGVLYITTENKLYAIADKAGK
ncbi:MAG: PQQ-binding-like beta-propeller repeat protein [Gemmataceae bacterium]